MQPLPPRIRLGSYALLLTVLLGLSLAGPAAAQRYTIFNLGTLGASSTANDINNLGQIIGNSGSTGFIWTASSGITAIGGTASASATNLAGQVAGTANNRGYIWSQSGGLLDLGVLFGSTSSAANDLNAAGQVAGFMNSTSGGVTSNRAFLWSTSGDQATGSFLGVLPGDTSSVANGINDFGRVVGTSIRTTSSGNEQRAFLWSSATGMIDLGTLGASDSVANAINNAEQVVGSSLTSGAFQGFIFSGGILTPLGTLTGFTSSFANGINQLGHVVGYATSGSNSRATLWAPSTGIIDLNARVPAGSGWTLTRANAINDFGQIVGVGRYQNQDRAFLLDPAYTWVGADVSVGPDSKPHVVWKRRDGTVVLWNLNFEANALESSGYFGPFDGWSLGASAVGGDGKTRLLWNNVNGKVSLWVVGLNGAFESGFESGPFSDLTGSVQTAVDMAVGPDNKMRVLWNSVNGSAVLRTYGNSGVPETTTTYGPFPGWTAKGVSVGSDGRTRLLWTNTDGRASLWIVNPAGGFETGQEYGPFPGWMATDLATGPDNRTRLLWNNNVGTASVWVVGPTGVFETGFEYGPFRGYFARSLAVGGDSRTRLLWNDLDGRALLMRLTPTGSGETQIQYGPF